MSYGGLSTTRLVRMHDVMARHVEPGHVPGVITAISRRGAVHIDMIGTQAVGGDPIRRDTIFRVASMTKPIVAVAALILVEECLLRLDEPVDQLLPELADRRVLKRLAGPIDETVPAQRPITLRDLLTFRMGFGQMMAPLDAYPILQVANEQRIGMGPPNPAELPAPDEWLRCLGRLPLMQQPGEAWLYHTGSDVLGVLLARTANQPLEQFLHERIFAPLGMRDTGFSVPPEKRNRLATSYRVDPPTGTLALYDAADETSQWSRTPAFPSGGGGLVSTIDDYLAFGQILLNGGVHGNKRILSRPSVELMTADHLTPAQRAGAADFLGGNRGWGFGVSVITRRDNIAASPGRFGWDGGLGTSWASDPHESMVGILMTQVLGFPSGIYDDFWTCAYQAIDD